MDVPFGARWFFGTIAELAMVALDQRRARKQRRWSRDPVPSGKSRIERRQRDRRQAPDHRAQRSSLAGTPAQLTPRVSGLQSAAGGVERAGDSLTCPPAAPLPA